jgi:hypothetical protein
LEAGKAWPLYDWDVIRILFRILVGLALLTVLAAGGWLAFHLVPRDDYFSIRHGELIDVVAGPLIEHSDGFVSRSLRLTADDGLTVEARLLRPAEIDQPIPGIVLLGGHRTGRDAVDVIGDPGPMAVIALNYPYRGDGDFRTLASFLWNVGALQRGLLDTPPALMLALDWMIQQPWMDPDRAELVGVSLGTPFATAAGAIDPRFRRVWLIHGGADVRRWIQDNLDRLVPQTWLRPAASWLLYAVAYGPSFRPEKWVPRVAPRPVVIVGAKGDQRLAPDQVEALYEAANEPKSLIWMEGPHVDTDKPEIVGPLLDLVRTGILGPPGDAPDPPE